jgi:hypothetical protein
MTWIYLTFHEAFNVKSLSVSVFQQNIRAWSIHEQIIFQVPKGEVLTFGDNNFINFEETGVREAQKAAFVLVAGGLGERLGYNGIKVNNSWLYVILILWWIIMLLNFVNLDNQHNFVTIWPSHLILFFCFLFFVFVILFLALICPLFFFFQSISFFF